MSVRNFLRAVFTALLGAAAAAPVQAGPPLAIDDPGVLEPGQWEIILAVTGAGTNEGDAYEAPVLDVSFGLTSNTQVSVVYPYVIVDPADGRSDSDFGNLEIGYKWRFFDGERLQLAVAPLYAFGLSVGTAARGLGTDADIFAVPLELEYALGGDWRLNAEAGYASVEDEPNEWFYGVAVAHPLTARSEILVEVYGNADTDFDDDVLNFTVGLDVGLRDDLHLLLSAGSGLREPDGGEELDYTLFLGLQYFR